MLTTKNGRLCSRSRARARTPLRCVQSTSKRRVFLLMHACASCVCVCGHRHSVCMRANTHRNGNCICTVVYYAGNHFLVNACTFCPSPALKGPGFWRAAQQQARTHVPSSSSSYTELNCQNYVKRFSSANVSAVLGVFAVFFCSVCLSDVVVNRARVKPRI